MAINYRLAYLLSLVAITAGSFASAQDVQVQSVNGQLVTGEGNVAGDSNDEQSGANDLTLDITIGTRVFTEPLTSTFTTSNPGFNIEPTFNFDGTANTLLPEGVEGLGENTDLFVEYVPTTINGVTSNFFFWDGSDSNDDGEITFEDINFDIPADGRAFLQASDDEAITFAAGDEVVRSGLIESTGEVDDVLDIPAGRLHEHDIFAIIPSVDASNLSSDQPDGIYVVSLEVVASGFENSDPIFFVLESAGFDPGTGTSAVSDLVADFINDNIDEISGDGLPGDFNGDGLVNAADFTVLRDGGADVDSFSDGFDDFAANFGDGSSVAGVASAGSQAVPFVATATAIPEPGTLMLVLAATIAGLRRRR